MPSLNMWPTLFINIISLHHKYWFLSLNKLPNTKAMTVNDNTEEATLQGRLEAFRRWASPKEQSLNGKSPTNKGGRDYKRLCTMYHAPSIWSQGGSFLSHQPTFTLGCYSFLSKHANHVSVLWAGYNRLLQLQQGILRMNPHLQLSAPKLALLDSGRLTISLNGTPNIKAWIFFHSPILLEDVLIYSSCILFSS